MSVEGLHYIFTPLVLIDSVYNKIDVIIKLIQKFTLMVLMEDILMKYILMKDILKNKVIKKKRKNIRIYFGVSVFQNIRTVFF